LNFSGWKSELPFGMNQSWYEPMKYCVLHVMITWQFHYFSMDEL